MTIYSVIDSLNPRKLIFLLENTKNNDELRSIMNEQLVYNTKVNYMGVVTRMTCLQYSLSNMINAYESIEIDDMRIIFKILVKKASFDLLEMQDSMNNNILHYLAILGDCELIRMILDMGLEVCINEQGKLPHNYCRSEKPKTILVNWSKIRTKFECNLSKHEEEYIEEIYSLQNQKFLNNEQNDMTCSGTNSCQNLHDKLKDRKMIYQYKSTETHDNKQTNQIVLNSDINKSTDQSMQNSQIKKLKVSDIFKKKCYEVEHEEVRINKYPGKLYVCAQNVIGFFSEKNNVDSVCLKVIVNNEIKIGKRFRPEANIDVDEVFTFSLNEPQASVRIFLVANLAEELFHKKEERKVLVSKVLNINENTIDKFHNSFAQNDFEWYAYKTSNILRKFKDMLSSKFPTANILKCHISYVSDEELSYINHGSQNTTKSLIKWLIYRKNSCFVWFRGYVNVRGDNRVVTHLWRRRFIQWIGYKMLFFNEFSGAIVGTIDISEAKFVYDDTYKKVGQNTIKVVLHDGIVEMQFDNSEKYEDAKNSMIKCIGALNNE